MGMHWQTNSTSMWANALQLGELWWDQRLGLHTKLSTQYGSKTHEAILHLLTIIPCIVLPASIPNAGIASENNISCFTYSTQFLAELPELLQEPNVHILQTSPLTPLTLHLLHNFTLQKGSHVNLHPSTIYRSHPHSIHTSRLGYWNLWYTIHVKYDTCDIPSPYYFITFHRCEIINQSMG